MHYLKVGATIFRSALQRPTAPIKSVCCLLTACHFYGVTMQWNFIKLRNCQDVPMPRTTLQRPTLTVKVWPLKHWNKKASGYFDTSGSTNPASLHDVPKTAMLCKSQTRPVDLHLQWCKCEFRGYNQSRNITIKVTGLLAECPAPNAALTSRTPHSQLYVYPSAVALSLNGHRSWNKLSVSKMSLQNGILNAKLQFCVWFSAWLNAVKFVNAVSVRRSRKTILKCSTELNAADSLRTPSEFLTFPCHSRVRCCHLTTGRRTDKGLWEMTSAVRVLLEACI